MTHHPARILVAKTSLDGHWRGVSVVARALREAGFEIILGGEMRAGEISRVAGDEDVDLIGLNVGGRIEVVMRILDRLEEDGLADIPVFAGGTISPQAARQLEQRGVAAFPPGSSLADVVAEAHRLTGAGDDQ